MIFYVTYNDLPSGIFSSQVVDVVRYSQSLTSRKVRLVSFISLRGFGKNRKKIKAELSNAIVLPMFPGVQHWKYSIPMFQLICYFKRPQLIIGRSVLGTLIAQSYSRAKYVYDGRGAINAEWQEYKVVSHPTLKQHILEWEKNCIHNSDYRIAVSQALVKHWQDDFSYTSNKHVVIPCTVNKAFEQLDLSAHKIEEAKVHLGIDKHTSVFAYAGSLAGWQSFELLYNFIKPLLEKGNTKLLLLSPKDEGIAKLLAAFPSSVIQKQVTPKEVANYLALADYGLLIREQSVTNKVASPVKFAEYLCSGLKVIISEYLGDYSHFVTEHNCGYLLNQIPEQFPPIPIDVKKSLRQLGLQHFTKQAFSKEYETLVKF
jgi:hypothetical protein